MAKVRKCDDGAVLITSFSDYSPAKVTTMGNITELMVMQKSCSGAPTRKIDKDHYCDLRTGELFEYDHIENRAGSIDSMRRTLARIRALVNTNVTVPENCRWITLTYAENMMDTERLMRDYEQFWKRFCRYCKKMGYGKPEYIVVIEPQGRGAWHVHAFFIWNEKAPFIPNDADTLKRMKHVPIGTKTMAEMWGQGITKTKPCDNCDNIGAYFSAYLGDIPLEDVQALSSTEQVGCLSGNSVVEKEFVDEQGNIKKKKFVKGGRLFLYPAGMNIVRSTKGVKQPEVENMPLDEARKKVRSAKQTFSRAYEIVSDDGSVVNTIYKSYYNSKRKE